MPRIITIDDVNLLRVTLYPAMDGTMRVEAVYQLLSGTTVVQTVAREMTFALGGVQKQALSADFDQIIGTIRALEL